MPQTKASAFPRQAQRFLSAASSKMLICLYGAIIANQMRVLVTRFTWLLVRVAFDSGQTRSLVTNILGRQPGGDPAHLKKPPPYAPSGGGILESSGRSAKGNIMRRTPQIKELIEAVEQWMLKYE